jgi:hypothetical protein
MGLRTDLAPAGKAVPATPIESLNFEQNLSRERVRAGMEYGKAKATARNELCTSI